MRPRSTVRNPGKRIQNGTPSMVSIVIQYETIFSTFENIIGHILPPDDPIVRTFQDFVAAPVPAATPEHAMLLKLFPFLLHIPDWFSGSWFEREVKRTRDLSARLTEMPYQDVEERMVDTSLTVFTLAMILYPDVWKRAQAEIDAVVGTDCLPDFSDRPALPYVDAIIRETVRWSPPIPLNMHTTSDSDIYNGYYIPKGASVVAMRGPRCMTKLGSQTQRISYLGSVGEYALTADASLWSAIATMLSTLDFRPPRDA
ncbi:cytochrome P450 [Lanmaoa asiatica]|nr:cytochrome P450 [Lanmaoa asiatica]